MCRRKRAVRAVVTLAVLACASRVQAQAADRKPAAADKTAAAKKSALTIDQLIEIKHRRIPHGLLAASAPRSSGTRRT